MTFLNLANLENPFFPCIDYLVFVNVVIFSVGTFYFSIEFVFPSIISGQPTLNHRSSSLSNFSSGMQ